MHRRLKFTMVGHWGFPSFAIGPPKSVRTGPRRPDAPDHVEWLMPSQRPRRPPPFQRSSRIASSYQTIDLSLFQFRGISCSSVRKSLVSPVPFETAEWLTRRNHAPDHAERQAAVSNIRHQRICDRGNLPNHPSKKTRGGQEYVRSRSNQVDSIGRCILFDIYPS
jgi:hypothetical protein